MPISLKNILASNIRLEGAEDLYKRDKWLSWVSGSSKDLGGYQVGGFGPEYIAVNPTDSLGTYVDTDDLAFTQVDISYDNGLTYERKTLEKLGSNLTWDGIDNTSPTISIRPVESKYKTPLASGDALIYNNGRSKFIPEDLARDTIKWTLISSNYQLVDGDRIVVDADDGDVTVSLPAGPFYEVYIKIFNTGNIIIDNNGHMLDGVIGKYTLKDPSTPIALSYAGEDLGVVFTRGLGRTVYHNSNVKLSIPERTGSASHVSSLDISNTLDIGTHSSEGYNTATLVYGFSASVDIVEDTIWTTPIDRSSVSAGASELSITIDITEDFSESISGDIVVAPASITSFSITPEITNDLVVEAPTEYSSVNAGASDFSIDVELTVHVDLDVDNDSTKLTTAASGLTVAIETT